MKKESIKRGLILFTVIFYIMSAVFAAKGYDKMTNYSNPGDYGFDGVNAYVGGDAYNYIINGNYATGFFVLSMGFLVSGTILLCAYKIIDATLAKDEKIVMIDNSKKDDQLNIEAELPEI